MKSPHRPFPNRPRQTGVAAVEFALAAVFFFVFVFGFIELTRALYLWNTMTEVTRRAARTAAVADFSSVAVMNTVRRDAMFGATSLPLAGEITSAYLDINYLQADGATQVAPLPGSPTQNLINCTANHKGSDCIRYVRVRLCRGAGAGCASVPYTSLLHLLDGWIDPALLRFPSFATITPVGAVGRKPGVSCPCP